jgi:hypothetical protein
MFVNVLGFSTHVGFFNVLVLSGRGYSQRSLTLRDRDRDSVGKEIGIGIGASFLLLSLTFVL